MASTKARKKRQIIAGTKERFSKNNKTHELGPAANSWVQRDGVYHLLNYKIPLEVKTVNFQ